MGKRKEGRQVGEGRGGRKGGDLSSAPPHISTQIHAPARHRDGSMLQFGALVITTPEKL